jgi:hypothetical protein
MNVNLFLLINITTYVLTLKIFFYIFKNKYYFPFRYADFVNFLFNIIIFTSLSLYFFKYKFIWLIIFVNLNLFYIFFHLINMIITSPRTKIIIDLIESKQNKLNLNLYLKKYNCRKILENRLNRLETSKQICIKNNYISLNRGEKNSFYFISLIFLFIENI